MGVHTSLALVACPARLPSTAEHTPIPAPRSPSEWSLKVFLLKRAQVPTAADACAKHIEKK